MNERNRRLFFALWPDPPTREGFAAVVGQLAGLAGGRPQRPDQLHVTLAFLGSVPESRLSDVLEAGRQSSGRPFEIVFDAVDHWPRPRVLCLTARRAPDELIGLVASLNLALAARGFATEERPFRAHLTLARKVPRRPPETAIEPLLWRATELSLVESITDPAGARYEPLTHWPLG